MKKILIVLLIGSFAMPGYSQGLLDRITKKAKEKAEQKAEDRAEEKLDEQIDKGLDKAEEALEGNDVNTEDSQSEENKELNRISSMMKSMGVSSEPVSVADSYGFSSKMKIHYSSLNKQGKVKDEGDVVTYISPGEKNFAYEFISDEPDQDKGNTKGMFIMDFTNNATIVLMEEDGRKTGVIYGIRSIENVFKGVADEMDENNDGENMDLRPKKTGRTKNILGHKCEEYTYETEKQKGAFWIAKSVKWISEDTYFSIFKAKLYSEGIFEGTLMESESHDKEKGTVSKMLVTELEENANVRFELGEYELTNIGSVQFGESKDDYED
ncbi:hypothetical protein ACT29H_09860 [Thermophagus sp. OGC60D27]|uniref:hypothetical protein n=1 Tax=Thermophagus sp. OGC60D27 TaxID=3458415 RepID=UPI0040380DF7